MTKSLDRRFRHVGRIKRSWGSTHKPTIRAMEQMLVGLFARGRLDILKMIQDKTYTPLEVYDAWRVNDLERLPTAATLAPLREAFEKWIAKKECSEAHRRSLGQSLRHVISGKPSRSYVIGDIPSLLMSLRERMQGKHPRSFNLARAAAQAFAKTTAGRNSKLWQDITAIEVLKVTAQRRKHPLTPEELRDVEKKIDPRHARALWSMALTGMGPAEYWGKWEREGGHIRIHGTKRAGRERVVPFVGWVFQPETQYAAFRRALVVGGITPYDMRRTYANWLEAAGIPRTRRKLYLGHGARDVTDLYERHEIQQFLNEDSVKLQRYIYDGSGSKLRLEKA